MTLPTWPSNVPSQPRDGWQMPSMFLQPVATEMEGGNQRLRAKPGDNVSTLNYPLKPLSLTEWGYLETFLRTNYASRWTMTLFLGGSSVSKTVQLDGGRSPMVSREGDLIHVALQLRVYGM